MPLTWVKPRQFMVRRGVRVYHHYNDQNINDMSWYWYTTDIEEDPDKAFDVRDLPGYDAKQDIGDRKHHRRVIAAAVDAGTVKTPEED